MAQAPASDAAARPGLAPGLQAPSASSWAVHPGGAVALVSLYDFENNAIRQLAAGLRSRGHRVVEIYFKDWINNHLEDPTPRELDDLIDILDGQDVGLVCFSLRASAYQRVATMVCDAVRARTGLPVLLGGWHVTVRPEHVMPFADAICLGEADASFPLFVDRWAQSEGAVDALLDAPGFWVRDSDGEIHRNPPLPLVEDLDGLPWRDYTSDDKWVVHRGQVRRLDPMAKDPLYQVMCSIGCIQKCSFCHNSFESGAAGPRLRMRSVDSVLAELAERRRLNPSIRRVRFDDEIFGLDRKWLREFAERYPREVGLPFDMLTEPTVVSEVYADLVAKAGARVVHMGIQSTEQVNRDKLERRASRATTQAAVERLTSRGIHIRYLAMVDIPGVSEADQSALFEFLLDVPRPFDLYLFSLTYFPGTKMVEDLLASGQVSPGEVEGVATKTFSQYRVDLGWPRGDADKWWTTMLVLQGSQVVPRRVMRWLRDKRVARDNPQPLVYAAHAATVLKTARTAQRMLREGELTGTLVRRWWNPQQMITM